MHCLWVMMFWIHKTLISSFQGHTKSQVTSETLYLPVSCSRSKFRSLAETYPKWGFSLWCKFNMQMQITQMWIYPFVCKFHYIYKIKLQICVLKICRKKGIQSIQSRKILTSFNDIQLSGHADFALCQLLAWLVNQAIIFPDIVRGDLGKVQASIVGNEHIWLQFGPYEVVNVVLVPSV